MFWSPVCADEGSRAVRRQSRSAVPPGAAKACPSSAKPRSRRQVNTRPAAHERRARRTAAQVGSTARLCRRRAVPSLGTTPGPGQVRSGGDAASPKERRLRRETIWFPSVRLLRRGVRRMAAAKRVSRSDDALCGTMRLDASPPPRPCGVERPTTFRSFTASAASEEATPL